MNTEIFDYLKALSQKDGFIINALNTILSAVVIIAGFLSFRNGATMLLYTVMFGCMAAILGLNSFKCFMLKRKYAWIFLILCLIFSGLTAIAIYALIGGVQ